MLGVARRDLNCVFVYLKSQRLLHPLLVIHVIVVFYICNDEIVVGINCISCYSLFQLFSLIVLIAGPIVLIAGLFVLIAGFICFNCRHGIFSGPSPRRT